MNCLSFVAAIGLAAGLAVAALPAQSIDGYPIQFGVMGGRTKPVGDLSAAANNDWSFGGLVLFGAPESTLRFRLDGQWQQIAGQPWGGGLLCGGCSSYSITRNYRVLDATANAVAHMPLSGSTRLYLIGGVGVYSARGTDVGDQGSLHIDLSSTITRFGLNGGVGTNFRIGQHAGFVEARYHSIFGASSFKTNAKSGASTGAFAFVPINVGFVF